MPTYEVLFYDGESASYHSICEVEGQTPAQALNDNSSQVVTAAQETLGTTIDSDYLKRYLYLVPRHGMIAARDF